MMVHIDTSPVASAAEVAAARAVQAEARLSGTVGSEMIRSETWIAAPRAAAEKPSDVVALVTVT